MTAEAPNDFPTEDDLPEGVTQPTRFPAHAAKMAGDPEDPSIAANEAEKQEFLAWKASKQLTPEEQAFKEWQAAQVEPEPVLASRVAPLAAPVGEAPVDPNYEAFLAWQASQAGEGATPADIGKAPYKGTTVEVA